MAWEGWRRGAVVVAIIRWGRSKDRGRGEVDRVSLLGSAGPSGSDRDTGAAWEAGPGTLGPRELRRWVVGSWSGPVRSVGWGPAAAERHLPRARLIDEGGADPRRGREPIGARVA